MSDMCLKKEGGGREEGGRERHEGENIGEENSSKMKYIQWLASLNKLLFLYS